MHCELCIMHSVDHLGQDSTGKVQQKINAKYGLFQTIKSHYTQLYVQPVFTIHTIRVGTKKSEQNVNLFACTKCTKGTVPFVYF